MDAFHKQVHFDLQLKGKVRPGDNRLRRRRRCQNSKSMRSSKGSRVKRTFESHGLLEYWET